MYASESNELVVLKKNILKVKWNTMSEYALHYTNVIMTNIKKHSLISFKIRPSGSFSLTKTFGSIFRSLDGALTQLQICKLELIGIPSWYLANTDNVICFA